jgi:hypothetical protein
MLAGLPPTTVTTVEEFLGMSNEDAKLAVTIVAAVIAATAASIAAILGRRSAANLAAEARRFSDSQRDVDYRVRQLNELYGPLRMLTLTNVRLRLSLPPGDEKGGWRLVHHLPEAWANRGDRLVVDQIIEVNKAIEELLLTKAGLMESTRPSYSEFMQHSRLLNQAWRFMTDSKKAVLPPLPSGEVSIVDVPFPKAFDRDIETAIATVEKARDKARAAL